MRFSITTNQPSTVDCKNNISYSKSSQLTIRVGIIECLPPYIISSLIDLGQELGWNAERIRDEIAAVERAPHLWQAGCFPAGRSAPGAP